MILVDANLLVYAVVPAFEQHERSRIWLEDHLNGNTRVGLPWASLLAFLRIVTQPRILTRPVAMPAAWATVREWLALPSVWSPGPTDRHVELLAELLQDVTKSELVPDAHLAALAIEHGLTLCSADRDFARFPALRWHNPLRPSPDDQS